MSVSDAEYAAWLRSDNQSRVVLVEAQVYTDSISPAGVETRYFSNRGYISTAADTPASTLYEDWLLSVPQVSIAITEQFIGQSLPAWGDLEIANENGDRDSWLNDGWDGRSITLLLGDPTWAKSDFRSILTGTIADIYAKDQSTLSLRIRDKTWQLNVPVQTNLIAEVSGGSSPSKGLPIPLCYGACFNVEPVLIDESIPKYQVHDGQISGIAAVYDNGVEIDFTADLTEGTFTLLAAPYGRITADVNGARSGVKGWGEFIYGVDPWGGTYFFTCADLIEHLVTTRTTLTSADLDSDSFDDLNTDAPQALGLYIRDRQNLIEVLDSLIKSVGGWYGFSRDGLLQLGLLKEPSTEASVLDLVADDLLEGDLRSTRHYVPRAVQRIGYRKNWTVMSDGITGVGGVAGAVTEERRADLGAEYRAAKAEDSSVLTQHLLATEPELEGTLLVEEDDALAEAQRRLTLHGVLRQVFQVTAFTTPYTLNLGDIVQLTHPRYGFSGGAKAQVVKIVYRPTSNQMMLELWK